MPLMVLENNNNTNKALTFPCVTAPTNIGIIIPGNVAAVFVMAIRVPA